MANTENNLDMSAGLVFVAETLDMPSDARSKIAPTGKPGNQIRVPDKNKKLFNTYEQGKACKVNQYMDARPFVRQGDLAQRRSNFQEESHFPIATEFARNAAFAPLRNTNTPFNNSAMPDSSEARYIIHGSDGPETGNDETNKLWI